MAILQVLSDIHLEFHRDDGQEFISSLNPEGVDILVLAGDIHTERSGGLKRSLEAFCKRWPQVVFVPGNHEYYHSSPERLGNLREKLTDSLTNLTWLDNERVKVGNLWFAGGTLWFPRHMPNTSRNHKFSVNDFRIIGGFEPWVYDEHDRCVKMLDRVLQPSQRGADVVVTHHIPAVSCVAPRYRRSPINHFFCHDMTERIESSRVPLWVYGHTHMTGDIRIGETRLVANPLGYPHEQGSPGLRFNSGLMIDIQ